MNAVRGARDVMVSLPGIVERYLPADLRGRIKDFFAYATGPALIPVPAASTVVDTLQVNTDADFLVVMANGIARDPAAPATRIADPPLLVQVTAEGSSRNLFARAIDWSTFFGDSELPGIVPYPKVISAGSQLSTQVQNLDAADDFDVRITYLGVKIFPTLEE